eukprot:1862270-Rhodomonas_salina.1
MLNIQVAILTSLSSVHTCTVTVSLCSVNVIKCRQQITIIPHNQTISHLNNVFSLQSFWREPGSGCIEKEESRMKIAMRRAVLLALLLAALFMQAGLSLPMANARGSLGPGNNDRILLNPPSILRLERSLRKIHVGIAEGRALHHALDELQSTCRGESIMPSGVMWEEDLLMAEEPEPRRDPEVAHGGAEERDECKLSEAQQLGGHEVNVGNGQHGDTQSRPVLDDLRRTDGNDAELAETLRALRAIEDSAKNSSLTNKRVLSKSLAALLSLSRWPAFEPIVCKAAGALPAALEAAHSQDQESTEQCSANRRRKQRRVRRDLFLVRQGGQGSSRRRLGLLDQCCRLVNKDSATLTAAKLLHVLEGLVQDLEKGLEKRALMGEEGVAVKRKRVEVGLAFAARVLSRRSEGEQVGPGAAACEEEEEEEEE